MKHAAFLVAACLLVLQARALRSGRAEIRRAAVAKDVSERIVHLRRAARWRAPLSPYPDRAIGELEVLAARAGDPVVALAAWEAVRGALLATRVAGATDEVRLHAANEAIAELRAGSRSGDEFGRQHAALERPRGPSPGATALALLGGLFWVSGGFCRPRRPRLGRALLFAGLPAFALGLWLA